MVPDATHLQPVLYLDQEEHLTLPDVLLEKSG